jgi:transcriptional regulator with XRE-family HTH domain
MREAMGVAQEELSYRAELHRTYIGSIESGKRNVSLKKYRKTGGSTGV